MLLIPLLICLFAILVGSLLALARRLVHGPTRVYRKELQSMDRPNYNVNRWRNSATEGPLLKRAVTQMEFHCSTVHQLADAWLDAINLNTLDVSCFKANVAECYRLKDAIEPDCAAVIDELRAIATDDRRQSVLLERHLQARAMTEWAQRQEQTLREHLAAARKDESVDVLIQRANGTAPVMTRERVEELLPVFTATQIPELRSVFA